MTMDSPLRILATAATSAVLAAPLALSGVAHAIDSVPCPTNVAVPKVYVVPMKGQMGTDIERKIYDKIVDDIKSAKPDIIIFELEASDEDRTGYLDSDDAKLRPEQSLNKLTEYRDTVTHIRTELREYPQVMWVKDAIGWSALLAFSFNDMYMTSDARLYGLVYVSRAALGWDDPDVAAKMMAAWTGIGKGLLELGGYPLEIGDALMFPDQLLSARWEGRKVRWTLDNDGTWIIDDNPKSTPRLSAQLCEDSGLADGLADSLDDLVFILGYREYNKIESGEKLFDDYVKSWRRSLAKCVDLLKVVEDPGGADEIVALGKVKNALEDIVREMERYPAVETRLRLEYGIQKLQLEQQIQTIKEQIRAIKSRERGTRTGGGGGSGLGGSGTPRR